MASYPPNPTNIDEVLDEFIDKHYKGFFGKGGPKDALRIRNEAVQDLKRIIEEVLPDKFNKKAMVEANKKHFHIMYGYNHALDDVRQQLEEKL